MVTSFRGHLWSYRATLILLGGLVNGLDLFSGIGGLTIAMEGIARPVAYCENDRYAQAVLLSRQRDGRLPIAPIWDDVRTLKSNILPPNIDIIWGGFPCQDISCAGAGGGLDGERSGLFFEIIRLAREIRPRFIFLENVPAITIRGLDRVLLELTALGYDCRWSIVSAAEVGAHHRRDRWFILAHSDGEPVRVSEPGKWGQKIYASTALGDGKDPHSDGKRMEIGWAKKRNEAQHPFGLGLLEGDDWDQYAGFFHRMDHGLRHRSHRLRGLGNAVVPLQAREAFERLAGIKLYNERGSS